MTPAARERLAEIMVAQRELAEEAARLLGALACEDIEIATPAPARVWSALPAPAPSRREGRRIGASAASKIAGRSMSSIYRDAARFGFGWKLPSGAWVFDEVQLRAFLRGGIGEIGEIGNAEAIDEIPAVLHLSHER